MKKKIEQQQGNSYVLQQAIESILLHMKHEHFSIFWHFL